MYTKGQQPSQLQENWVTPRIFFNTESLALGTLCPTSCHRLLDERSELWGAFEITRAVQLYDLAIATRSKHLWSRIGSHRINQNFRNTTQASCDSHQFESRDFSS